MVEIHSWRLSPLGPAKQLQGGSTVISESSFCILLAEEVMEVAEDHCRELPAHPLIWRQRQTDRETDRETEYSVLCLGYGDTDIYITNILNKK